MLSGRHEPVVDAGIGHHPRRVIRTWRCHVINVRLKPKLTAQGEEQGRPASVVGVLQLEGDWHVGLDGYGGVRRDVERRRRSNKGKGERSQLHAEAVKERLHAKAERSR